MKAVFLSPYSFIKLHSIPEYYLTKVLATKDFEIFYITCGGLFPQFCVSMSAVGMTENSSNKEKETICRKCQFYGQKISTNKHLKSLKLSDFYTDQDEVKVNDILKDVNQSNFLNLKFRDIEVGRISVYENLLRYKKMSLEFDDNEWASYKILLRNSLKSLIAWEKIYKKINPDVLLTYSPQYGVNGVCSQYMNVNGKKAYFIEGSSSNSERYEALRVWDWEKYGLTNPALSFWNKNKNSISLDDVKRVEGHLKVLYKASSYAVYSSPVTKNFRTRDFFQIPLNKKIVLAALSSFDEAYAAYVIKRFPEEKVKSTVFEDQFQWIRKTIEYLAGRKDLILIIRQHPRDFPNKREQVQSEQAEKWHEILSDLPENIILNKPQDNISIYDLLKDVDLLLTGWSATGIEALIHGIPVVTYDRNLPSYPQDIHYTGNCIDDYMKNIEKALKTGRGSQLAFDAYRWYAFNFSIGVIKTPKLISYYGNHSKVKRLIISAVNLIFPSLILKLDLKKQCKDTKGIEGFIRMIKGEGDSFYSFCEESHGMPKEVSEYLQKMNH